MKGKEGGGGERRDEDEKERKRGNERKTEGAKKKRKETRGWRANQRRENERQERKGPRPQRQDGAALAEPGADNRLAACHSVTSPSKTVYLVEALNERLGDHKGHVIQGCGEKAKFREHFGRGNFLDPD